MPLKLVPSRLWLILLATVLLSGCGSTRVAIPMASQDVVRDLPQSGVFTRADRLHWEGGYDGIQRLIIDHRDSSAYIKKEIARSVLVVSSLSAQSSELLIRSDDIGWLWNLRDNQRERQLARDIRAWADQRLEPEPTADPSPEDDIVPEHAPLTPGPSSEEPNP